MIEIVEIDKIIFNPSTKKYCIRFKDLSNINTFNYLVSSEMAKKISMSLEGISSNLLSSYELFMNLIDLLKTKVDKVIIFKNKNLVSAKISLRFNNDKIEYIYLNTSDAIIIALKTFSTIYLDSVLFNSKDEYEKDATKKDNIGSPDLIKDKILNLKKVMQDSIISEEYETAAIIRDRINELKEVL